MSEEWSVPDVIDTLAAALRARPGVASSVRILTAHPGAYHPLGDAIAFYGSEHEEKIGSLGGEDFDYYEIYGSVYTRKPGVDESVVKDTRDQVSGLYRELLAQIEADRTIGGLLMRARVNVSEFNQGTIPDDRWAEIRFRIECRASPT